jgi:ABC-type glycerol-3-phosphate transport system substrate-binding protein
MGRKRGIWTLILSVVICCTLGCGSAASEALQGTPENEIITNTAVDQNKTMITVRVEYVVGEEDSLEKALEEKFPTVDIVLRHDGAFNSTYSLQKNLETGTESDLIISGALPYVEDVAGEYLYDLSSESFVDNYYMSAVDNCASADGKLYYLPGPSNVYGIVYDKTMFEEYGWELPHSYSEFVALLETIRQDTAAAGDEVVPLQASLMYPDALQILFNTYGYDSVYRGADNAQWLREYQAGSGSMVGHMEPAVEAFMQLFSDGMLSVGDVEVQPRTRSEMLYVDHTAAMIIECQNAVKYVKSKTEGLDVEVHDIAMMPFWTSDEEDSDYLYAIPEYYLAINRKSAEESEEKQKILVDIMDYLSSEEGQKVLIEDDFVLSEIQGVSMEANSFSENVMDTIERGQIINTFNIVADEDNKQVETRMLELLPDLIDGNISVEEFLKDADTARDELLAGTSEESYGTSETTLTRLETAYTVANMYADVMDVPIGICMDGGWYRSTNGYIYEGDITETSLSCITPDKEHRADAENPYADSIVSTELTGEQILSLLNHSEVRSENAVRASNYVAYGLTVEYDPWAENGAKVISCKTADGKEIDPAATYQVAYFNGSLALDGIEPENACDQTWTEAFVSWLAENGGTIEKPEMTLTLKYNTVE